MCSSDLMIFFVLSGYFVGGSVLKAVDEGKWSWGNYLSNRLVRLWIVLIPALMLTLFWDSIGIFLNGCEVYDGQYDKLLGSVPHHGHYSISAWTFFGNVFFLHDIFFERFGSDGPIWSLANEFWYYIVFPCIFLSLRGKEKFGTRVIYFLLSVAILFFLLPRRMDDLFLVWLLGVFVYVIEKKKMFLYLKKRSVFSFIFICFMGYLILCHSHFLGMDQRFFKLFKPGFIFQCGIVGVLFAGLLPFLIGYVPQSILYKRVSYLTSEVSYTLYLTHFPLMFFYFCTFRLPSRSVLNFSNLFLFLVYFLVLLGYAFIVWFIFERRTNEVRSFVREMLSKYGFSF